MRPRYHLFGFSPDACANNRRPRASIRVQLALEGTFCPVAARHHTLAWVPDH